MKVSILGTYTIIHTSATQSVPNVWQLKRGSNVLWTTQIFLLLYGDIILKWSSANAWNDKLNNLLSMSLSVD